jgi:hypothetical protein
MYKTYSKTETIKEFRLKESRVPWDLMRLTLIYISTPEIISSPISYFLLNS